MPEPRVYWRFFEGSPQHAEAQRTRPDAWILNAPEPGGYLSYSTGLDPSDDLSDVPLDEPELDPGDAYHLPEASLRTPSGPRPGAVEPAETAPPGYGAHRLKRDI